MAAPQLSAEGDTLVVCGAWAAASCRTSKTPRRDRHRTPEARREISRALLSALERTPLIGRLFFQIVGMFAEFERGTGIAIRAVHWPAWPQLDARAGDNAADGARSLAQL